MPRARYLWRGAHSSAAASGRYAGRKAASYAMIAPSPGLTAARWKRKGRVYAPLKQSKRSIAGKSSTPGSANHAGLLRPIQHEKTLQEGLRLLQELRESEASTVYAANPHELAHSVECQAIITVGEAVIHASLARRASSAWLNFVRLITLRWIRRVAKALSDQTVEAKSRSRIAARLLFAASLCPTYEENYFLHCDLAQ